jgi:hypothetical protein
MSKTTLVIQPSAWRWSLYDPDKAPAGELAALVASANEPCPLVKYALENLDSPVRVYNVPALFTEGSHE